MDKIFIKDLLVRGIIGISEAERAQPQDILLNIILFTDIRNGAKTDDINNCTNYRTITKSILAHIPQANKFTVEALAEDIAQICLENSQVIKVRVCVEKPGAVRFSKSVGVEITRKKDDF